MATPVARAPRVTRIWRDTIRQDTCRHAHCGKTIWFAQNVRTGHTMPFATYPVPLTVQPELETRREMWAVDLAQSHFADCVGAATFRRRGRR